MFGLLNTTQIYGVQTTHEPPPPSNHQATATIQSIKTKEKPPQIINHQRQRPRPRSTSSLSDSVRESKFFSSLSSMQAGIIKSPTNLIEKFLLKNSELLNLNINSSLNSYDNIKNYKNLQNTTQQGPRTTEGLLNNFNCLQGSYRSNSDSEFYEAVNVVTSISKVPPTTTASTSNNASEMTIKCSKNLLAQPPQVQAPATLQNYQKLSDYEQHDFIAGTTSPEVIQSPSSGASSGEFNGEQQQQTGKTTMMTPTTAQSSLASSSSSSSNSFYKRLSFGGNRSNTKHLDVAAQSQSLANESASDNSSSSITTTTTTNSLTSTTTTKSNDLHRSSSASSAGDCVTGGPTATATTTTSRDRDRDRDRLKCKSLNPQDLTPTNNNSINGGGGLTPERSQRRKLIQMITNYEQQTKHLQRELAKEKRRRTEELSGVVKSLICFESKLKTDMKAVNQRLADKDNEICRLVRQNRALRKKLAEIQRREREKICDEGVVVGGDGEADDDDNDNDDAISVNDDDKDAQDREQLMADCLVLEALQCNNCRKQFYDIELKEGCTQTSGKDGSRKNADRSVEHGSSSDDTVSSSFCGARRSVRYTSKRTSGTFRDYMRSRAMNIDDPSLEQNSEENTSTISRDDSQTSYEKLNVYSRTIERMHGVKCESEQESSEHSLRSSSKGSRPSSRCSSSKIISSIDKSSRRNEAAFEEDDGIFSPTQDDDFEEEQKQQQQSGGRVAHKSSRSVKTISRRAPEFSEASPKQIYETSTDDWYASASDQEEIVGGRAVAVTVAKSPYGQGAVNPVLECVNQILLQQSMDETTMVVLRNPPNDQLQSKSQRPQDLQLMNQTNLPRRSSLSGRRNSRTNENGGDSNNTRKRVHFSTKNSMVHVPRNDDVDEDDDEDEDGHMKLISPVYHTMQHGFSSPSTINGNVIATDAAVETFNYESIYSNEYEPVGSERNSSNLYVDMESTTKLFETKSAKKPPALPPKPANLIKFKKSLQQLDEMPDEQQDCECDCDAAASTASVSASEPDYCSISEVNVGITNVQIVAVVHKPPESVTADDDDVGSEAPVSELDLEVSTVASDETCGAISQKTDEIEEIFADIPKLPNVAAIIAPKKQVNKHQLQQHHQHHPHQQQQQQQNSDYLIMSPKVETSNMKTQNARRLALNINSPATTLSHELLSTPMKSPKLETSPFPPMQLSLGLTSPQQHLQFKRKAMPNILAEINQRLSLPSTPTTPTATAVNLQSPTILINKTKSNTNQSNPKKQVEEPNNRAPTTTSIANDLPLQAEFDWYNLDAEYGRSPSMTSTGGPTLNQPDLILKVNDHHHSVGGGGGMMLAEIHEDHESVTTTADEYNLDEEFSLSSEQNEEQQQDIEGETTPEIDGAEEEPQQRSNTAESNEKNCLNNALDFPLYNENSPAQLQSHQPQPTKAKKIKKNLANFEKFIEGSGLSTKPLPSKRKIYFAGPYV